MSATTATSRRSRAVEFFGSGGKNIGGGAASDGKKYPTAPEGVAPAVAKDIAERRRRTTTEDRNREITGQRIRDSRVTRPTGPGIYETVYKPLGLAAACAYCTRQIERGGNCPGLAAADPAGNGKTAPDCHGLHDADRAAVRRAMDERESRGAGETRW